MLKLRTVIVLILLAAFGVVAIPAVSWWVNQRAWFDIYKRQLATIESLDQHPPDGWSRSDWSSLLGTAYSVWANVTYHPDYSHLTIADMERLHAKLEEIASKATPENSFDSADQVFAMMLEFSPKKDFISRHRQALNDARQP